MTWDEIADQWDNVKHQAKRSWPSLHEAELEVIDGNRSKLIDKVRDAQSMSHEAAAEEVEAWRRSLA